mgnify:FL=1
MRIVFMGTPDFSVRALGALAAAGHEIVAVYSQPPRKSGRGQKLRPSPIQQFSEVRGWPIFTPVNFRNPADVAVFKAHKADIAVVVAYGLILPSEILKLPELGCLNIHASLLPRWRGAAPIHRAIMAGDRETGVCIMQMDTGLDTGPVRICRRLEIGVKELTAELHDRLAIMGASAVVDVLADLPGHPKVPQTNIGMCYATKIDKSEARIDWTRTAEDVDRQIRGLSPFPGAWCMMGDQRLKVLASSLSWGIGVPGQVLTATEIACGQGSVMLHLVQPAGKNAQTAEVFQQGHNLPERLG